MKTLFSALVVATLPIAAVAQCSGSASSDQAMSCIAGTEWDEDAQGCVPTTTS